MDRVTDYDAIITQVFRQLRRGHPKSDVIDFEKSLIEDTIRDLYAREVISRNIRNVPDIKYTYDARRDFPDAISQHGHWSIIGRGKSRYSFVRIPHNNLIRVPQDLPKTPNSARLRDQTPASVLKVVGTDEQATLAQVRYNDVIGNLTGLSAHHVQSHERTTVSAGQIEVDDVYVAEDAKESGYVIPISAKGGNDCLSYTQALNVNLYGAEKDRFSGMQRIPLGIVRAADKSIYVIQFSTDLDIRKIRIVKAVRYAFS